MIEISHVVFASPEQMEFIIEGMRNPMNSWEKSDSNAEYAGWEIVGYNVGPNDYSLMQKLSNAGTDHRKFMRMMPVYARITAPLYWWKEFDTYKVGTVANSCSTMHKIQDKEFTLEDFSVEHLNGIIANDAIDNVIHCLNFYRSCYIKSKSKDDWWQMIQLLPSSYNQTRNAMMNYETLANIYKSRRLHKLDEWREFCKWLETLPYSDLITNNKDQGD